MERGRPGEVYNIGRADEVSVADFARMVARAARSASKIHFVPGRPQDISRRCPDTSKAERELDWHPRMTLGEGLRVTIAWYERVIGSRRGEPIPA
jgi:nucleoside-diphosphate-sugar epimerase